MLFSVAKESVEVKNSTIESMSVRINFSLRVMQIVDFMCFYLEREVCAW
jgi:hypothetical protein